jgi:hypothetical protein
MILSNHEFFYFWNKLFLFQNLYNLDFILSFKRTYALSLTINSLIFVFNYLTIKLIISFVLPFSYFYLFFHFLLLSHFISTIKFPFFFFIHLLISNIRLSLSFIFSIYKIHYHLLYLLIIILSFSITIIFYSAILFIIS